MDSTQPRALHAARKGLEEPLAGLMGERAAANIVNTAKPKPAVVKSRLRCSVKCDRGHHQWLHRSTDTGGC